MNRDDVKKLLPIIEAFADGKTVEFCEPDGQWVTHWDPAFNADPGRYRIKPAKRLRPYKPEELPPCGTVLVHISCLTLETPVGSVDRREGCVMLNAHWVSAHDLFANWQHLDGTPCGVEEEA
jgi:hypothetical protein